MTILFASGEDTGFTAIGTVGWTTTLTPYRSSFARIAMNISNSTTVADPPANRAQTPVFTSVSSLWIHAQIYCNGNNTTSGQQDLIIRSPDGVSRLIVRQTGSAGTLKVSTRASSGTITDLGTATVTIATQTVTQMDLFVNYASSGAVQLYLGGVQAINFSGDPRTDAATQLNQVELAGVSNSANTTASCWSEVIVADEDTRAMSLWSLPPAAAGNTQGWTPNTLANINKTTINDATLISTSSNNTLSEWTTSTSAPSGAWAVKAIVQEARVSVGGTGPQHFDWVVRTAAADFTAGASVAPSGSLSNFSNMWTTNPNTSSGWVIGDIAAGFNLGIKSLA